MQSIYILSCETPEKGGGIYRYSLSDNGLKKEDYYPCDRPMYAVNTKKGLCVLLRQPFEEDKNGGCFTIDKELKTATEIQSTKGIVPCHLCVEGEDCYITNYLSGNIVHLGKKVVTHEGKGINPIRQDTSHTHCVTFSPNKKYVLCCDLGLDTLFCYDRELSLISKAKIEEGYGLRHAVFSKNGKYIYAISEMVPAVHIFSFEGGRAVLSGKIDIPCAHEKADGAAIRLSKDGKKLYVSLRVENALVVFDVKGEKLELLQKVDCGGDSPRDFNIIEDKLIVTNEKSDNVLIYALKEGLIDKKLSEIKAPKPLCCVVDAVSIN